MKKHLSIISIFITLFMIFIAYLAYENYLKPAYENGVGREKKFALKNAQHIVLKPTKDQQRVFSLEFIMSGTSSENIDLTIGKNDSTVLHTAMIKKGEINFEFKQDWYDSTCVIFVESYHPTSDSLTINYRFLSIDD